MPLYFFDLHAGSHIRDEDGVVLESVAEVYACAIRMARELMAAQILEGELSLDHRIEVLDADRRPILTLPFRSAVNVQDQMQDR